LLVAAERLGVLVHDEDDDRSRHIGVFELAEVLERSGQAGNADREAGGGDRLAAEARDEAVVAAAAGDRAEADDLALVVRYLKQQLSLVDRAGVVFEAAHDRRVDLDAAVIIAGSRDQLADLGEFLYAFVAGNFTG